MQITHCTRIGKQNFATKRQWVGNHKKHHRTTIERLNTLMAPAQSHVCGRKRQKRYVCGRKRQKRCRARETVGFRVRIHTHMSNGCFPGALCSCMSHAEGDSNWSLFRIRSACVPLITLKSTGNAQHIKRRRKHGCREVPIAGGLIAHCILGCSTLQEHSNASFLSIFQVSSCCSSRQPVVVGLASYQGCFLQPRTCNSIASETGSTVPSMHAAHLMSYFRTKLANYKIRI